MGVDHDGPVHLGVGPHFSDPDGARSAEPLMQFLDAYRSQPDVAERRAARIAQMQVTRRDRALDLGCATGEFVRALGEQAGLAVGADISLKFLLEARRRFETTQELVAATAARLPFASGSFDIVSTERVLQHVADLDEVGQELARILAARGRLVCHELDHGTLTLPGDPNTVAKLARFQCQLHAHGRIGRELGELAGRAGLTVRDHRMASIVITDHNEAAPIFPLRTIVTGAREAGFITDREATQWIAEVLEAIRADAFYLALTEHTVVASKP